MNLSLAWIGMICALPLAACAQSADWQQVVWREPQVRYLLADVTLGGNVQLYRDYAAKERDPDSREAIRLWDAGVRAVNTNEFERKWVTNKFGRDGRVMRVVLRGTTRTITGNEVLTSRDTDYDLRKVRFMLLELTFGRGQDYLEERSFNADAREALRRWKDGARVLNINWFRSFKTAGLKAEEGIEFRHNGVRVSHLNANLVRLNSDLPYPETNVRYFMADIALGGSIEFYRAAAERDHEMGCLEAVRRIEDGYRITNLDQFERKKVDGKTLITRKGSNQRISGNEVKLSSD